MESPQTVAAQSRYSAGAIALHWLIALAIIANWFLAHLAEDAPKAQHDRMMGIHFAIGMSVLILSVVRILWRLAHKPPAPNPAHKAWERVLSSIIHKLFYILIIALPLTGYLMLQTYAGGMDVSMFGIFGFPGIPMGQDKAASEVFGEVHEVFGWMMVALFLLHVAGAWKHQLFDRDGTLFRMLPWGRIEG